MGSDGAMGNDATGSMVNEQANVNVLGELLDGSTTKQDVLDKLAQDMELQNLSQHTRDYYYRNAKFFSESF